MHISQFEGVEFELRIHFWRNLILASYCRKRGPVCKIQSGLQNTRKSRDQVGMGGDQLLLYHGGRRRSKCA